MASLHPVPEKIDFSKVEEDILKLWNDINAFQECLKQSKGKPSYSFYDGPPFATGLPHYGHILAGTIKDVVTRYAHQNGYNVERRFGWDCHGLPVEYEIDKTLGITGPADVAKIGIAAYNQECRNIVGRYTKEWEEIITRMGRWIDFKNDYKTMYPSFMESVWWVFSELWHKGLVYKGVKVMPYSTACNTPLSNFESGQNYKEVNDPAVTVSFPLVNEPEVSLIAWTTTPWTLPSNLALCVNKSLQYVKIKMIEKGAVYILMEARLPFIFKNVDEYEILEKFPGKKLEGLKYKPIFPYFSTLKAFVVLTDDYVTEDSGTGIVHQAPYFGEDDYRVCLAAGIITCDQEIICPVDASGRFTEPVTDFLGLYVKDADKKIIKHLKQKKRLVRDGTIKHNYPFCWRSETPLIYKAVPSWFIRVQEMSNDLLMTNKNTYWVPDYVKEKRFGNWLRDARDWAVSRNRYWGTPIPLWSSKDGEEIICISSIAELEKLSGVHVVDIHRESIDHIEIPSKDPSKEPLRRVTEVFDCWFESGSMPYAQLHYPFENVEEFNKRFPADFVAEGIDQTRGWFYTLLVISTALFNKAPFKNLIANGLILASDGQKMSKRKKNYPNPMEVVHKYGADALRLYLVSSPVVRAENLRFKEEGVRDILKDIFLPWYNAYRFLVQNVLRMNKETGETFVLRDNIKSDNIMDKWILSFTQSLLMLVQKEMAAYRLYTVVPKLVLFIDNLTNWYVRMNRKRFKGETGLEDNKNAIATLSEVLLAMIKAMSPFTPFLCEHIFQNLRHLVNQKENSIHYLMFPKPKIEMIDESIERAIKTMQTVIELGRVVRDRKTIPVKYPLPEVIVVYKKERLSEVELVKEYIRQELNVRSVTLSSDRRKYGVALKAEPDHKALGARLKSSHKEICSLIKELKDENIQEFLKTGEIELLGHKLQKDDVRIMFSFTGSASKDLEEAYEVHSDNDVLILLDIRQDSSMTEEGTAKEIINRIQKLRKKAHLVPTDAIKVFYLIKPVDSELNKVAETFKDFIETTIKAPFINKETEDDVIIKETFQIKGVKLTVIITGASTSTKQASSDAVITTVKNKQIPVCRYVNVILNGVKPSYGITGSNGIILLENPKGENYLSFESLKKEVNILFGLYNRQVLLICCGKELTPEVNVHSLSGNTIYVEPIHARHILINDKKLPKAQVIPRFVNIELDEKWGCALLENPVGDTLDTSEDFISRRVTEIFKCQKVKNFTIKNEYEVKVSCV